MSTTKAYILSLFDNRKIDIPQQRINQFDAFTADDQICTIVQQILQHQQLLMDKWALLNRISTIQEQSLVIPNATVGKSYETTIDLEKTGLSDLAVMQWNGLEELGLQFDPEHNRISGIPLQSGDLKIKLCFRLRQEPEDTTLHEKSVSLIINPDPKSLWKNKDSDREDPYWKEDNISVFAALGGKHLLAASRRGRSHANTGGFREDDLAFRHFDSNGWNVVAVSDGAGSARLSRAGSRIACNAVIDHFGRTLDTDPWKELDMLLTSHQGSNTPDTTRQLNHFVYTHLGQAALYAHHQLEVFAAEQTCELKDLHATLIFVLFKKYDFGYALFSFGVGDCPIGLISKDRSAVTLMNTLDVGEFGGGTRFITMQDIFRQDNFASRFGCRIVDDFSFLFLMTDGIYDPKFVVEANLEKPEQWNAFIDDLQGNNPDQAAVRLEPGNTAITGQLSTWMDFWSPGNHDDRTLVIIF
jgi:hypothetical protein